MDTLGGGKVLWSDGSKLRPLDLDIMRKKKKTTSIADVPEYILIMLKHGGGSIKKRELLTSAGQGQGRWIQLLHGNPGTKHV